MTQTDLTRYAKAMRAAGIESWRVEFEGPDGSRTALIVGPEAGAASSSANPWDRLLTGRA